MTTDNTAHPVPTPAPVAVPETLAHLLENLDCIEGSRVKVDDDYEFWLHSSDQVAAWLKAFWPGPTVDLPETPRPEPVVAPLPSEVGALVLATIGSRTIPLELQATGVWLSPGRHGSYIAADIDSWVRLVPEDDEDTVRVPKVALIELNAAVMDRKRDLVDAIEEFNDEVRS